MVPETLGRNYPKSGWTPIQATALQKRIPTTNPAESRHPAIVLQYMSGTFIACIKTTHPGRLKLA